MVSLEKEEFLEYDFEGNDKSPYDNVVLQEDIEAVRKGVEILPDKIRRAIVLVYYEGRKYREAAEELGIPVGTVKSRLHAGIKRLEELFGEKVAA